MERRSYDMWYKTFILEHYLPRGGSFGTHPRVLVWRTGCERTSNGVVLASDLEKTGAAFETALTSSACTS